MSEDLPVPLAPSTKRTPPGANGTDMGPEGVGTSMLTLIALSQYSLPELLAERSSYDCMPRSAVREV